MEALGSNKWLNKVDHWKGFLKSYWIIVLTLKLDTLHTSLKVWYIDIKNQPFLTRCKLLIQAHNFKGLSKSYWMHVLVLKLNTPDSNYRLSNLAAEMTWFWQNHPLIVHAFFKNQSFLTRCNFLTQAHSLKDLLKSYWMHVLVLKLNTSNSSYRLSNLAAEIHNHTIHEWIVLLYIIVKIFIDYLKDCTVTFHVSMQLFITG